MFQLYLIQYFVYYPLNCTVKLPKTTLFYIIIKTNFFKFLKFRKKKKKKKNPTAEDANHSRTKTCCCIGTTISIIITIVILVLLLYRHNDQYHHHHSNPLDLVISFRVWRFPQISPVQTENRLSLQLFFSSLILRRNIGIMLWFTLLLSFLSLSLHLFNSSVHQMLAGHIQENREDFISPEIHSSFLENQ